MSNAKKKIKVPILISGLFERFGLNSLMGNKASASEKTEDFDDDVDLCLTSSINSDKEVFENPPSKFKPPNWDRIYEIGCKAYSSGKFLSVDKFNMLHVKGEDVTATDLFNSNAKTHPASGSIPKWNISGVGRSMF